jgi:3-oxoacyl-[acyl-carrier-protein] synthase-3
MGRGVKILGFDFSVPENVITNDDLSKIVETNDEWIVQRTGIKERRVVSGDENSTTLAYEAAKKVLQKTNINPLELDLIIVASSSPNKAYPSVACEVQALLGAKRAAAFDIKAACSGFLYALSISKGFIKSGMYEKILVVASDTTSKFVNWDDRTTCVLFGDGAGAAVVCQQEEKDDILEINLSSRGDMGHNIYLNIPSKNCPLVEEETKEEDYFINMSGREVYKYVMVTMPKQIKETLKKAGKTVSDIDYFIPHQANLRMIEALSERLGFGHDKVITNVEKYGNISAASIPSVITEGIKDGRIKLPATILASAFGAGMTHANVILSLDEDTN